MLYGLQVAYVTSPKQQIRVNCEEAEIRSLYQHRKPLLNKSSLYVRVRRRQALLLSKILYFATYHTLPDRYFILKTEKLVQRRDHTGIVS